MAVFSRQLLSHLTFPKVFCLQTSLSNMKMIDVFTNSIEFHQRNLSRVRWRINQFEYCGRRSKQRLDESCSFCSNYLFYAISFCLTKELISGKAAIACTERQEKSSGEVFSSFVAKNMLQMGNRTVFKRPHKLHLSASL